MIQLQTEALFKLR